MDKNLLKMSKRPRLKSFENSPPNELLIGPEALPTTIYNLPEEVLISILKYLEHGDLLTSRLVNKTFNNTISSYHNFPSTKLLYLFKSTCPDSQSTLSKSSVPWKRLRFEKCRFFPPNKTFPLVPPLSLTLTSIELSKSIISWDQVCQTLLIPSKSLEEFAIIQCKRRNRNSNSNPPKEIPKLPGRFFEKVTESLQNLKSISLELRRISDMTFYLQQLNLHSVSTLVNISLREIYDGVEQVTLKKALELLTLLLTLIEKSSSSLKSLQIHFVSPTLIENFFPKVIHPLINLIDLHTFKVKRLTLSESKKMERDLRIFANFIQSQKNLKEELHLPMAFYGNVKSCTELISLVNKDILKIQIPRGEFILGDGDNNFHFPKLSHLSFDCRFKCIVGRNKSYPMVRSLEILNGYAQLIVTRFPNLTKLSLNGNYSRAVSFEDADLQLIIRNLPKLKCLVVGDCSRISDFGICGVSKGFCEEVFKSRRLSDSEDFSLEIPPWEQINGRPISILKGLTHLTFTEETLITDVGILYGFRFKELRYLSIKDNPNITDWGFETLSKFNPNLDWAYLGCGPSVTTKGIESVQTHLRRIKQRNLIFTRPNVEYCSSDESYAFESDGDEDNQIEQNM